MSKETPRLPQTPKSCSSPVRLENAGSDSSRSSDSAVHWRTLKGADSPEASNIKPSSWDNSGDELPIMLEKGHIYSSESPSNRKSVAAEINELKKQFFQSAILEAEAEIEDLREEIEMSLKNDRRKSPARVRRRTKSSSSSSTAVDVTAQSSPKREEELMPQYDTIFDNMENISPLLELDSKFYLEKFFTDLRRKRISVLESTVNIATENVQEDFLEVALDDSDDFIDLTDSGYLNRTCRKLSQILEVEENKKESDKDSEELFDSNTLFLKFSRNSEEEYSPLNTSRSIKEKKVYENTRGREFKFKPSSANLSNSKRVKCPRECLSERQAKDISGETDNKVISLTARTETICLDSSNWEESKENSNDLDQIHADEDVNWSLIENLKLDLIRSSENPTPRDCSRRERNSGSRSNGSGRDGSSRSPRFKINVGKESARSLKVEEIKTPKSTRVKSSAGSDRSIKDAKSSCGSVAPEAENISLDLKSPSLGSRTSNQSLELHDILLNRGSNTNRDAQSSGRTIEPLMETSNRSELYYRSNQSEPSSRSPISKSSKSSRSRRFSLRTNESRLSSERSEKIKLKERTELQKSPKISSRTDLQKSPQISCRTEIPTPPHVSCRTELPTSPQISCRAETPTSPQITCRTELRTSPQISSRSELRCSPQISSRTELRKSPHISCRTETPSPQISSRSELRKSPLGSRTELRRSPQISSRTELEPHRKINRPQSDKSYYRKSRNRESSRSTPRRARTPDTSSNCAEEFRLELKSLCESLKENPRFSSLDATEIQGVSSNRSGKFSKSHASSRSEIITSESLDKPIHNNSIEELKMLLNVPLGSERSGITDESEDEETQRSKNESESDGRLSIINEVSSENIPSGDVAESPKTPKESAAAGNSEETEKGEALNEHRIKDKLNKPESEVLWNDLIETFNEDQNQPFNWQENFLGFLDNNQKNSINSESEFPLQDNTVFLHSESGGKEEDDFILSGRLTEDVLQSPQKVDNISPSTKSPEKNKGFSKKLYLDIENNFKEKMKNNNDAQNLYYFGVEKTEKFGIGEYGDVTCWNLGASHPVEEGKPKGSGDGILPQYRIQSPLPNQDNSKIQKKVFKNIKDTKDSNLKVQKNYFLTCDDLTLTPLHRHDVKPSKSDTCINAFEPDQYPVVDFSKIKKSAGRKNSLLTVTCGKRKRKAGSPVSSEGYLSTDYESDGTDNQELGFEGVRRSASLSDIVERTRRSEYDKLESNENLYNSGRRLYENMGKEVKHKDSTNLNMFVPAQKKENKTAAKSNWLIFKQPKTCHRENKKSKSNLRIDKGFIKKESGDYLSFRSRNSVPILKLRDSNCFQNFYKRVISVFCVTSDSSLSTSK